MHSFTAVFRTVASPAQTFIGMAWGGAQEALLREGRVVELTTPHLRRPVRG
jgi:hypothetical protein